MEKMPQYAIEEFSRFLVEAQKNTFASGQENHDPDGSTYAVYENERFSFKDKWIGSKSFVGSQIARYKPTNSAIWGVAYKGLDRNPEAMNKGGNDFLKLALKNPPQEFPVRGPRRFEDDSFKNFFYYNDWTGDLFGFVGADTVTYHGSIIFGLSYAGGIII